MNEISSIRLGALRVTVGQHQPQGIVLGIGVDGSEESGFAMHEKIGGKSSVRVLVRMLTGAMLKGALSRHTRVIRRTPLYLCNYLKTSLTESRSILNFSRNSNMEVRDAVEVWNARYDLGSG